jgi:hypothetical protein
MIRFAGMLLLLSSATSVQAQRTGWHAQADARVYAGYFNQTSLPGTQGATSTSWLMVDLQNNSQRASLGAHAMLSADPLIMGECGQPRLLPESFACGDAESMSHPLIMNLGLRVAVPLGRTSLSLIASAIGEPAYGPAPHFMRASAQHDPGEPLTHHFFNPAHSAHGVLTGEVKRGAWAVAASAFNPRLVHNAYRIDFAPLRGAAARVTMSPDARLQVQASAAYFPADDVGGHHGHSGAMRAYSLTASGLLGSGFHYTAGCAAHRSAQRTPTACLLESTLLAGPHIFFARVEAARRLEQVTVAVIEPDGSHVHLVENHMLDTGELAAGYGIRLPLSLGVQPSAGVRAAVTRIPAFYQLRYQERHAASVTIFVSARLPSAHH